MSLFTHRFIVVALVGVLALAPAFAQDFNRNPVKGTYVLDRMGQIYSNGNVGSATYEGVFLGMEAAVDMELTPTGGGLWVLDQYGGLYVPSPENNDAIAPNETDFRVPYFGASVAADMEVIPQSDPTDKATWGLFILDVYGGVHAVGAAANVVVPSLEFAPYFGFDIARDLELTPTGQGYFILDGMGAVHAVGDALQQIPSPLGYPIPYFNFDIAKDLELLLSDPMTATPETGWYMLDGIGGLHTMGLPAVRDASPGVNPFITEEMDNIYFFFDLARDFEVMQDETYFQLDALGGIHPKETYPFDLEDLDGNPLHYFLGMPLAVDMEFLREPVPNGAD